MSEQADILKKIEQRQNTIQVLSQMLVDRFFYDAKLLDVPERFELAGMAGGIRSACNELEDLIYEYRAAVAGE